MSSSIAARCAASPTCLASAENRLANGEHLAAQRILGLKSSNKVQRLKHANAPRWYNAAGLAVLLNASGADDLGLSRAASYFSLALQQDFSPSHLAAAKNLYWITTVEASEADETLRQGIEVAASRVVTQFQQTNQAMFTEWHSADGSRETAAAEASGVTIFDLPIARSVCAYPLLDRHRNPGEWRGVDQATRWKRRYFDVLKRSLTRYLSRDLAEDVSMMRGKDASAVQQQCTEAAQSPGADGSGLLACEAPWHIGQGAGTPDGPWAQKYLSGLVHLELLLEDIIRRRVPGDVIECGCYAAGTSVLMRAVLDLEEEDDNAHGEDSRGGVASQRRQPTLVKRTDDDQEENEEDEEEDEEEKEVKEEQEEHEHEHEHSNLRNGRLPRQRQHPRRLLLADSFEGIPQPRTNKGREIDSTASWPEEYRYAAGQARARSTLKRYGLLDERVVFVPGYFNVSLPAAPTQQVALIHVDADAYDSVMDALEALYERLTPGGFVVVDDWHLVGVRSAVLSFRARWRVKAPLLPVPSDHVTTCTPDWNVADTLTVHPLTVVYWEKNEEDGARR